MVVALLTTALLIVNLHPEIWKGLLEERILTLIAIGVSLTAIIVLLAIGGTSLGWTGFRNKTVWDFLQLLIVPLMLVAIGLVFSLQQDARQQRVEDQRAEAERELAEQRAQDEALQAYLDQMSQLMLERKLLEAEPGDPVHTLAQARTSTIILRLDAEHNESVTRFLSNSGLALDGETSARLLSDITLSHATLSHAFLPNADLISADLSGADLSDAHLSDAHLSGTFLPNANLISADLSDAHLSNANLSNAYLHKANLSGAGLSHADLSGTILPNADLSGADLSHADLSCSRVERHRSGPAVLTVVGGLCSDLSGANLSDANLWFADLHDADLRKANLRGATALTDEKIAAARSLKGATMPNGQKYEDWLKSQGRGEDGENDGSS
jgi:uncharacterized protein YjbI with pentapeptide repeats